MITLNSFVNNEAHSKCKVQMRNNNTVFGVHNIEIDFNLRCAVRTLSIAYELYLFGWIFNLDGNKF